MMLTEYSSSNAGDSRESTSSIIDRIVRIGRWVSILLNGQFDGLIWPTPPANCRGPGRRFDQPPGNQRAVSPGMGRSTRRSGAVVSVALRSTEASYPRDKEMVFLDGGRKLTLKTLVYQTTSEREVAGTGSLPTVRVHQQSTTDQCKRSVK
jgi:hypothetical protein